MSERHSKKFTFQYGQIRNKSVFILFDYFYTIYIPVWLDQKPNENIKNQATIKDLHSSMVRLETVDKATPTKFTLQFTFQYGQIRNYYNRQFICKSKSIYIPVWLDQKLRRLDAKGNGYLHLHSSMVRLETTFILLSSSFLKSFTFQYGQIRNIFI